MRSGWLLALLVLTVLVLASGCGMLQQGAWSVLTYPPTTVLVNDAMDAALAAAKDYADDTVTPETPMPDEYFEALRTAAKGFLWRGLETALKPKGLAAVLP